MSASEFFSLLSSIIYPCVSCISCYSNNNSWAFVETWTLFVWISYLSNYLCYNWNICIEIGRYKQGCTKLFLADNQPSSTARFVVYISIKTKYNTFCWCWIIVIVSLTDCFQQTIYWSSYFCLYVSLFLCFSSESLPFLIPQRAYPYR